MGDKYTNIDGEYLTHNPSWHTEDSDWKAEQIGKMLRRNGIVPKTVIEIGCGAGKILHYLAEALPEETRFKGYEISPDAYSMCCPTDRITFTLGEMSKNDAPGELLLMIDVFEHVEDYFGFLRNHHDRGRYKIFHIPLELSIVSLVRGHLMIARKKVGHLHYFTKETALASLKDCGYRVVDHFYTPVATQLSRTLKSKITRIPRQLLFSLNRDAAVTLLGGYSLMVLAE